MIYKTLKKVSDYCQLVDKRKFPETTTTNGITFTNNGDGTITANGTAIKNTYYTILSADLELSTHKKYLLTGCPSGGSSYTYFLYVDRDGALINLDTGNGSIGTPTKSNAVITIFVRQGLTLNNLIFKPQLFDLTEMYGAGNEPTTVEQFRQDFPEELYDYKPYCFVKSYKNCLKVNEYCQLLDKSKYSATQTINGVTFTNNGDGTITINGTATANIYWDIIFKYIQLDISHKYLLCGCPKEGSYYLFLFVNNDGLLFNQDKGSGSIGTPTKNQALITIYMAKNIIVNNLTFKPQLFDLTEMYGAGNEPTTVEQFRQDFPNELYDYKPYSIITSYKKSFKVTNSILL